MLSDVTMNRLAEHGGHRLAAAAIGDAGHLGAAAQHEQFAGQVRQAAGAGMRIVELAGVGLGVVDELPRPTSTATTDAPPRIWKPSVILTMGVKFLTGS